jgi:EAL and modified HD-GYP domain-containing signal transduction protein
MKIEAFLTGLLSNLSAILRIPTHSIYDVLPLPNSIRVAIENRDGELGQLLDMADYIEHGINPNGERLVGQYGLDNDKLNSISHQAHQWYLDIHRN